MGTNATINEFAAIAKPFESVEELDFIIEKIKDKKIVMLGESTHGTNEFYKWRLDITKTLVEDHGFNFIAVEGDWPACQAVNQFVNKADLKADPLETLKHFNRWPTWMWANYEMLTLMEWLSEYNQNSFTSDFKVGFHGLDVYSLYESINAINEELEKIDPKLADKVMRYYSCFDPYLHDEKAYVRSLYKYPEGCETQVAEALFELFKKNVSDLDILQNAKIVQQAEHYYRSMMTGEDSWNIRDQHMMSTLDSLLNHYGTESKAIIWAHNTHIGDYRGTDMLFQEQVNIGGLAREKWGTEKVALIGMTTYKGSVIASNAWDGKVLVMEVPEAKSGSLEDVLHQCVPKVGSPQFAFWLDELNENDQQVLNDFIGHRAIGVVYHPQHEALGNYVPTIITKRYNGMLFFDETSALTPLRVELDREKIPETWPHGARV